MVKGNRERKEREMAMKAIITVDGDRDIPFSRYGWDENDYVAWAERVTT